MVEVIEFPELSHDDVVQIRKLMTKKLLMITCYHHIMNNINTIHLDVWKDNITTMFNALNVPETGNVDEYMKFSNLIEPVWNNVVAKGLQS